MHATEARVILNSAPAAQYLAISVGRSGGACLFCGKKCDTALQSVAAT
jgi:hypothetical protein